MASEQNAVLPEEISSDPPSSPKGPFLISDFEGSFLQKHRAGLTWKSKEHVHYVIFLHRFLPLFQKPPQNTKDQWVLFKMMAEFLKTRNPNQCRMHHKQLISQAGSAEAIVRLSRPAIKGYKAIVDSLLKPLSRID